MTLRSEFKFNAQLVDCETIDSAQVGSIRRLR